MARVVVLCCVGLTPELLGEHTPQINALAKQGFCAPLTSSVPAVTCSAQTTMLTGTHPNQHGIVGNGWYFRELGEVWLWRQSQRLVQAPHLWQHDEFKDLSVHKHFWWYAMNTDVALSVTPRPAYHADGAKSPDIYSWPPAVKSQLIKQHGEFPLFKFWGPLSNIISTDWIADSFCTLWKSNPSALGLCYLPHLDYDLQRFGPRGDHIQKNLEELDACVGRIVNTVKEIDTKIMIVSEYGIEAVDAGIPINRELRNNGFLQVTSNATGELLDPGQSEAFAVCDHQIAHVYCKNTDSARRAFELLRKMPGIERVYQFDERSELKLDHERSGELIALAAPGYWFQYEYWLDDRLKPDFAHSIEIHKKPGYDPRELFFDPQGGKFRAAKALMRKKLGMRYVMNPVPLDPGLVKGSHGRLATSPEQGPLIISDSTLIEQDHWHQIDVAEAIQKLLRS